MSGINTDLRLSGLSSGVDTESVVKGMLSLYQARIDKGQQTSIKLGWTADAYREVNTLIKNFRSKYMSVLSGSNMLSPSAYSTYSVKMLKETSAVTIDAASSVTEGTFTIDSITQLAQAATAKSTGAFTGETYSSSTKLSELQLANGLVFDGDGKVSFSINGKEFTFTGDNTIGELINAVNISDAGVSMSYSSLTKGFTIKTASTGSDSQIDIVNISGNALSAVSSAFGIAQGTYNGKDAVLSINGFAVTKQSNTFSIDGISYSLSGTSAEPISFTVSKDIESTVNKIKDLVSAYNELVGNLQSKVGETVYRKFPPLTDTQKEEMSDKEIELWEEKAKSGMLHGDPYVSDLLSTLRSALFKQVEGVGLSLSDIGLNTGLYSDGAKITIDENKLRTAITGNPEKVRDLFTRNSGDFDGSGFMVRISEAMLSYTKETTSVALDTLEDRISDAKDSVEALQKKMDDRERVLWQRFTAMETAMSKLNNMSGWLAGLFSNMSS